MRETGGVTPVKVKPFFGIMLAVTERFQHLILSFKASLLVSSVDIKMTSLSAYSKREVVVIYVMSITTCTRGSLAVQNGT